MKNLTKFLILMLVATTLVGCGKIPTLENGEEAVATLNEDAVQLIDFIENHIIDGHIDISEKMKSHIHRKTGFKMYRFI